MSSARVAELFRCLKLVRRTVDTTHDLAARTMQETATDRALAEHFREAATGGEWGKRFPDPPDQPTPLPVLAARVEMILGGGAGLHTLCLRLIDERATLATQLESIHQELERVNIVPRTENVGAGARGSNKNLLPPSIPKRRPIKASLTPRRKGRA